MPFGHGGGGAGAGTPVLLVENQVPSLWHTVQQFSLRVYCLLEVHSVAGKKDCVGEGELDISFPREACWPRSRLSWAIGFAGGATVLMVCRII